MRRSVRRSPARACDLVTAQQAVAAALTLRGLSKEIRAERVTTEWIDLVGPKIAARTRPQGIVGRALVIEVASSAWLHELSLLRPTLLRDLLARVGEPRLFDDLSFRIAGRDRAPPSGQRPVSRAIPSPPASRPPASGLMRERIVQEVDAVDDAELRALIARVRIGNDR